MSTIENTDTTDASELFEDIDMTAKVNEITQAFYGMELAEQIAAAPSSFGGYQKIDTMSFFG